jgi:peptide deformylase
MVREIKTYPDPVLAARTEPVEDITDEIRELAQDMAETMYENNGIGLAAPQVGQTCRIITVDTSGPENRDDLLVVLNPVITSAEGQIQYEEGCLSLPGFKSKIQRAEKVVLNGLDLEGQEISIEADGLLAVCLQHEVDHLEGTVLLDRSSRLKRSMYQKKIKKCQKPT